MTTTSRDEELKQFATDFNKSLGKYIPKTGRITELEDFSNDFNSRLSIAYEKFSQTVKNNKINLINIMNIIIQDNERLDPKKRSFSHKFFKINPNKKKKIFSNSIF